MTLESPALCLRMAVCLITGMHSITLRFPQVLHCQIRMLPPLQRGLQPFQRITLILPMTNDCSKYLTLRSLPFI
jgi:hypothetical protein